MSRSERWCSRVLWLVCLWSSGCARHVFSPPARLLPVESVAIVGTTENTAALEGGAHTTVFGPTLASLSLRGRSGINDTTEAVFEAHAMYVTDAANSDSQAHPVIYALRTGAKLQVAHWLALTGGLGTGFSAGGAFASPDVGFVLAHENRYLVPFIGGRALVSFPFAARAVDLGTNGGGTITQRPTVTLGLQANLGLRFCLSREARSNDALLLAVGLTDLVDRRRDLPFFSISGGVEGTL